MFCEYCGRTLSDTAKAPSSCGTAASTSSSAEPPAAIPRGEEATASESVAHSVAGTPPSLGATLPSAGSSVSPGGSCRFAEDLQRLLDRVSGEQPISSFSGYEDETQFVIDNWKEMTRLLDVITAAKKDTQRLVTSIAENIARRSWFAGGAWQIEVSEGGFGVEVFKRSWKWGKESASIGVNQLELENLLSPDGDAISFVYIPSAISDRKVWLNLARRINSDFTVDGSWFPRRSLRFDDLKANPESVLERVVGEIESLKVLEPEIDALFALYKKASPRRRRRRRGSQQGVSAESGGR